MAQFNEPEPPGEPPADCGFAVKVWIMSGRQIDYAALPFLCEMLGIVDIETLLAQLICIRDNKWKT